MKLTLLKSILLAVSLLASLFLVMVAFTLAIAMAFGAQRFTFGNEFFIQAASFTIVIAEAAWATRLLKLPIPDMGALFSLRAATVLEILLAVLAAVALTFPLSQLDTLLQALLPADEVEREIMIAAYHPASAVERVFVMLSLVVAAPVGEELVFRGAMMTWIRDGSRGWVALVLTAVLFGLSHASIPRTILLIIPVGFLFGWVVMRTGSVFASIAAHAAFNGFPLVAYWSGLRIDGYNTPAEGAVNLPVLLWMGGTAAAAASLYFLEVVVKRKSSGAT
jgi:membrane protease YdiL (CAAX protease family)